MIEHIFEISYFITIIISITFSLHLLINGTRAPNFGVISKYTTNVVKLWSRIAGDTYEFVEKIVPDVLLSFFWIIFGLVFFGWGSWIFIAIVLCPLFTILLIFLSISSGEISPLPWIAIGDEYVKSGPWDGFFFACSLLLYYLWVFILPARIHTYELRKKTGESPRWPYVMNVLFGSLVVTPDNPIFLTITWIFDK